MKNYIERPQATWALPSQAVALRDLRRDAAFGLDVNNMEARIAFATTVWRHVQAHHALSRGPAFSVTITPSAFTFRLDGNDRRYPSVQAEARASGPAATFDIRRLQALVRQAMGDIPFIGMIEASLYKNWGPHGACIGYYVAWHVHLLAWDTTRVALSSNLKGLRRNHRNLLGGSVAHILDVGPASLERSTVYMLKAPQKVARVNYFPREWISPETGEVKPPGWHQQKQWMGTGNFVRMMDVMAGRYLHQLCFGNGEGTALARTIRADARTEFWAWEAKQPYMRRSEERS